MRYGRVSSKQESHCTKVNVHLSEPCKEVIAVKHSFLEWKLGASNGVFLSVLPLRHSPDGMPVCTRPYLFCTEHTVVLKLTQALPCGAYFPGGRLSSISAHSDEGTIPGRSVGQ